MNPGPRQVPTSHASGYTSGASPSGIAKLMGAPFGGPAHVRRATAVLTPGSRLTPGPGLSTAPPRRPSGTPPGARPPGIAKLLGAPFGGPAHVRRSTAVLTPGYRLTPGPGLSTSTPELTT